MERSRAKKYNRTKLRITLTSTFLELLFWSVIISSGYAAFIAHSARGLTGISLMQFYLFVLIIVVTHMIISLPLSFYSGYVIEKRYSLTNQTILSWLIEQIKGLFIALILGLVLLTVFYYLLEHYPKLWWFGLWIFLFLFTILLTRIAPLVIFPLFYKFKPLDDQELKSSIHRMAEKRDLNITGIFQFNLSKTTKKANAAFTGIGKSKRVILGDTLLENFEREEIETIFAHELGHYVRQHLLKGIALNSAISLLGLLSVFLVYDYIIGIYGYEPARLEALPYLALLFFIYNLISGPLANYISRKFEYEADLFAVKETGQKDAFINSMRKLSNQNLADENPHPLVEILLYSHPSIQHRIQKITEA